VSVKATAKRGSAKSWLITATSNGDATKQDAVKATVVVK
jgi:hypothetical protein